MREFRTYKIKEMPAHEGNGQISIPEFMVSQPKEESKSMPVLAIIQVIAFIALCWFFMALDTYTTAAWIGMPISLITFVLANIWGRYDLD